MTDSKTAQDIKAVVWAACDEMLREGTPPNRITGRKVATLTTINRSHTTVSPHVQHWHAQRAEKEKDAIKQTQMSSNFVKALHKEVEERVASLRQVDAEQMQQLNAEINDMIETSDKLESELKKTQTSLKLKEQEATRSASDYEHAQNDKVQIQEEHKKAINLLQQSLDDNADAHQKSIEQLQQRLSSDADTHQTALNQLQQRREQEITTLKIEHKEVTDKFSDKRDELTEQLKNKTAECAEATVKAAQFDKLTSMVELEQASVRKLTNENMRLNAELASKIQALNDSALSVADGRSQRDKAQDEALQIRAELSATQNKLQRLMLVAAKNGIEFDTAD